MVVEPAISLVCLVPFGQAEATDTSRVLLGEEAFELAGVPQRVATADVHAAARQRRPGEYRTEDDLLEHGAGGGIEGHQFAAADGGEVGHAVAHGDARADDVADLAVPRLAGRAAHL